MMLALDRFGSHIPQKHVGYTYIGETKIYCPYYVIGLEAIRRTETELSYVYETIMRFISLGICSVPELCKWMGLDESVLAQIVSDMAIQTSLVDASKRILVLTPSGKESLEKLRAVRLDKFQFNEVYLNAITGEFLDMPARDMLSRPPRPFPYFDGVVDLDIAFINGNFEKLSIIYSKRTDKGEEFGNNVLFRILSIAYRNIKYAPIQVHIYVNDETRKLLAIFPNNKESMYSTVFYEQLNRKTAGVNWLFDLDQGGMRSLQRPVWNTEKSDLKLTAAIDAYQGKLNPNEHMPTDFESLYWSERALLSGEATDLIQSARRFSAREIIIISTHMLKYLTDDDLLSYWKAYLGEIRLRFVYTSCEESINENLSKAKNHFLSCLTDKQQRYIEWQVLPKQYDRTVIICSPGFVIGSSFSYEEVSGSSSPILMEHSTVSFDAGVVSKWKEAALKYASV